MISSLQSVSQRTFVSLLAMIAVLASLAAKDTHAAILNVPSQFPTIQSAIDAGANGDEIVIASGVYPGGFDLYGKRLVLRSVAGAASTIVDLSATGGTACRAENQEPAGTTLHGLTIRGASTGAIRVGPGASLALRHCQILDSSSNNNPGAGVLCLGGNLDIQDSTFVNLSAQYATSLAVARGGAISLQADAYATITGSTFTNCRVMNTAIGTLEDSDVLSSEGGALSCHASTALISGCSFQGCSAQAWKTRADVNSFSGRGLTIARGGAVSATGGSAVNIQSSNFGGSSPCQALSSVERNNYPQQYGGGCHSELLLAVTAQGGAISATQNSSLEVTGGALIGNAAVARVGTAAMQNYWHLKQVEATAEGGSVYYEATTSSTFRCEGIDMVGGQARIETYAIISTAVPYINSCITASTVGHGVALRPGSTTSMLLDCMFRESASASVAVFAGTGATFNGCSFVGNAGVPLTLTGNAALLTQCAFRSNDAHPIVNTASGSGPTVIGSVFCANAPNQILGNWIDGGSNTFSTVCVANDCNNNGVEDASEIASGAALDCNSNARPDSCDIADGSSDDCDENDIPDECQYPVVIRESPSLSPVQSGTTLTHSFSGLSMSGSDVRLLVSASADLSSVNETILVRVGKTVLGTLFQLGGADCTVVTGELLIDREVFNNIIAVGSTFSVQFIPSFAVTTGTCPNSWLTGRILYQPVADGDCNANSIPDICDILGANSTDVNHNEIPDECEDIPACLGDLNLDGYVNAADLSLLLAAWGRPEGDLNGDGLTGGADLGLMLSLFRDCSTSP